MSLQKQLPPEQLDKQLHDNIQKTAPDQMTIRRNSEVALKHHTQICSHVNSTVFSIYSGGMSLSSYNTMEL